MVPVRSRLAGFSSCAHPSGLLRSRSVECHCKSCLIRSANVRPYQDFSSLRSSTTSTPTLRLSSTQNRAGVSGGVFLFGSSLVLVDNPDHEGVALCDHSTIMQYLNLIPTSEASRSSLGRQAVPASICNLRPSSHSEQH